MKNLRKYLLIGTVLLAVSLSCGDLEEVNINPNEPLSIPTANLITQAEWSIMSQYWSRGLNFETGMLMVQHFAQSEYTDESRYVLQPADFDAAWSAFYSGGMADLNKAKELINKDKNLDATTKANQLALIDILMAFGWQFATDLWGNIPFSQAHNPDKFQLPAYDAQKSIYEALIASVKAAVAAINTSGSGFGSADVMFNGKMDRWQKFGNALLLRMGMRISDLDEALAKSTVSAALSGNIISGTAEEARFVFDKQDALANPFYRDATISNRDDFRISAELLDVMNGDDADTKDDDPRIKAFADPTATGTIVGLPYGLLDNEASALKASTSRFTKTLRQATAPANVLRFSEVKLLEAEAIAKGFVSGDAAAAYKAGVTASMKEWGITDATAIAKYLANNAYDAANATKSIATQMWIALYGNGIEAWAYHRRTDFPVLKPAPKSSFTKIPTRILYPQTEFSVNEKNVKAAGPNGLNDKVAWDVR